MAYWLVLAKKISLWKQPKPCTNKQLYF